MEENKALKVVDALRDQGVNAHLAREGVYKIGVRVVLPDGREAVWDTDDTPGARRPSPRRTGTTRAAPTAARLPPLRRLAQEDYWRQVQRLREELTALRPARRPR